MVSKQIQPPAKGIKSLRDPGEDAVVGGADLNPDLNRSYDLGDSPTRAAAAVALRISGASYSDIARVCEYSSAFHARQAVERALAEDSGEPEERAHLRVLTDRRLNRLLQSVMGKAVDVKNPDQLAYNRQALALVDRIARLHGVDAPQTLTVYQPQQEEVNAYIAQMLALHRQATQNEADILDAEMVED